MLNRIFIAYAILYVAFVRIFDLPDTAGRIPSLLFLFLCILNIHDKGFYRVFTKTPVLLWLLWDMYSFANWYIAGIPPEETTFFGFVCQNFILQSAMLITVYYEGLKDLKGTTMTIIFALCLYMLMGFTMQDLRGASAGTDWSARGGELLGNSFPLNACVLIFCALFADINGWIKAKHLYMAIALGMFAIFIVSTRKAFGGAMIMILFYVVSKMARLSAKRVAVLLLSCAVMYGAFSYVMEHSLMGKRMEEIEKKSNSSNNAIFNKLGDRASHYVLGWKVFQKHPVTGVGIKNVPQLYHWKYPLHTEYMTQLAENGIVGTALWLLFMGSILKSIWRSRRYKPRPVWLICLSGMACVLFLGLTTWIYEFPRYFAIYGLILACCDPVYLNKEDIQSRLWSVLHYWRIRHSLFLFDTKR